MIPNLSNGQVTGEGHFALGAPASLESRDAGKRSWNRLWQRSGDAMPFSRWQCLQKLYDSNSNDFRLLQIRNGRSTSLGLALMAGRNRGINFYRNANTEWFQSGNLLSDKLKCTTMCFDKLAIQIKQLPGSFVYLDWMNDSIETQRLIDALRSNGCIVFRQHQFRTGLIRLTDKNFDEYFASRSKGFRKKIRSSLRKLQQIGEVNHECFQEFVRDEQNQVVAADSGRPLNELLHIAFDIEDLGWKKQTGSTFNRNPEAQEAITAASQNAALAGHLQIHFLTVDQRVAAFDIGFTNGDTYYSYKISYDPEFAPFGPGQLLTYKQIQRWMSEKQIKLIDTVGELSEATNKWCNAHIDRIRLLVSTGGRVSNLALRTFATLKPLAKRILRR